MFFSYHFIKRTNGYELSEDVNKPLSLKYNCVAVFDNHAKVMIVIQQSGNLILVFNETNFLDNTLKLLEVRIINALGNQSLNDLFEVKPSKNKNNFKKWLETALKTREQEAAFPPS